MYSAIICASSSSCSKQAEHILPTSFIYKAPHIGQLPICIPFFSHPLSKKLEIPFYNFLYYYISTKKNEVPSIIKINPN
jgi:hypothetical protein